MKNRIAMIWLSALTIYSSYTISDTYSVLKNVQGNQEASLTYMQKSASILKRLKILKLIEPKDAAAVKEQPAAPDKPAKIS